MFSSQKELKEYVKNIIAKMGTCNSVKTDHPKYYRFLLKLFRRHPNYNENMRDLY